MALLTGEVLVVNAGSTSLKLDVVDGAERSRSIESFEESPSGVVAAGHRVVHGGDRFLEPVLIDAVVEQRLGELIDLAPLHNRPALDALAAARRHLPDIPHVAVFDTAFHATIPAVAATYALPRRFRDRGIRRYGFHGLSVQWAAGRVRVPRLVVCHLGGGSSVTAVRNGSSIDTTMGFSPLEGVPMATRSGSVDPGALLHLLRDGVSVEELDHALEHESGLLGLSGTSGDVRELEADTGDAAALALGIYCYRVAQAVAAMAAALAGLDALVFTGGVGEHSSSVRAGICSRLGFLGVELDEDANGAGGNGAEIGAPGAAARVVVIQAQEAIVIARAVRRLANRPS